MSMFVAETELRLDKARDTQTDHSTDNHEKAEKYDVRPGAKEVNIKKLKPKPRSREQVEKEKETVASDAPKMREEEPRGGNGTVWVTLAY